MEKGDRAEAFERFSRAVDAPMTILALLMVPILVVPLIVHLPAATAQALEAVDLVIWALFVVEYGTKLYLAPDRPRFVRQNIPDLVIVAVPFLRPLRIARSARVVRLLRLSRLVAFTTKGLGGAGRILRHAGLRYVLLVVVVVVFAAAGIETAFEHGAPGSTIHGYADAIWWSVVTITTVGYGDTFPVTAGGKGVAVVLMITGIGLFGVLAGTLSSYFVERSEDEIKVELGEVSDRLRRVETLLERLTSPERATAQEDEASTEAASRVTSGVANRPDRIRSHQHHRRRSASQR